MKVSEVIDMAIIHKQMPISDVYGRTWLNDAKYQLALRYDTACLKKSVDIVCTSTKDYYDLPTDCLRVTRVESGGYEYNSNSYLTDSQQIRFNDTGTHTIFYLVETPSVTTNTETPIVHPLYHRCMSKHIAAMELKDIKPEKYAQLEAEFITEGLAADKRLKRPKRKGGVIPVPSFR